MRHHRGGGAHGVQVRMRTDPGRLPAGQPVCGRRLRLPLCRHGGPERLPRPAGPPVGRQRLCLHVCAAQRRLPLRQRSPGPRHLHLSAGGGRGTGGGGESTAGGRPPLHRPLPQPGGAADRVPGVAGVGAGPAVPLPGLQAAADAEGGECGGLWWWKESPRTLHPLW